MASHIEISTLIGLLALEPALPILNKGFHTLLRRGSCRTLPSPIQILASSVRRLCQDFMNANGGIVNSVHRFCRRFLTPSLNQSIDFAGISGMLLVAYSILAGRLSRDFLGQT